MSRLKFWNNSCARSTTTAKTFSQMSSPMETWKNIAANQRNHCTRICYQITARQVLSRALVHNVSSSGTRLLNGNAWIRSIRNSCQCNRLHYCRENPCFARSRKLHKGSYNKKNMVNNSFPCFCLVEDMFNSSKWLVKQRNNLLWSITKFSSQVVVRVDFGSLQQTIGRV